MSYRQKTLAQSENIFSWDQKNPKKTSDLEIIPCSDLGRLFKLPYICTPE
jgi:hypothetical protein